MIVTATELRDVLHALPNPDKEQGQYRKVHIFAQNLGAVEEPSDSLTTEDRALVFRRRRREDDRQGGRPHFEWVLEL